MAGEVEWGGVEFRPVWIHDGRFFREPGLFAFVRDDAERGRLMLMAGQADNLATAAGSSHPLWTEALRLGINELHVSFSVPRRVDRLQLVSRIVRHVQPILNVVEEVKPEAVSARVQGKLRA